MTKTEEIDLYRQFVEGLPRDSYLADYLADTVDVVQHHIQTDQPCNPIALARSAARSLDEQRRHLLAEVKRLHSREKVLREAVTRHRAELDRIRQDAGDVLDTLIHLGDSLHQLRNRLHRDATNAHEVTR